MPLGGVKQCTARAKSTGERCGQPAVKGYNVCRLHGAGNVNKGKRGGRPPIHGRYSVKHRAKLAEKYGTFLADPRPGDLAGELAMMRALFQDYLDRFEDGVPLPADDIGRLYSMLGDIGKLVERISKILNSTALTAAEVQYLQARIVDLIGRYIEDEGKRQRFVEELRQTVEVRRIG